MKTIAGRVSFALLFICTAQASAQLQTYAPLVDAVGMGGVAASLPSDNAMAQLANPAQTVPFNLPVMTSDLRYDYARPTCSAGNHSTS